jgi:hypothetical protein
MSLPAFHVTAKADGRNLQSRLRLLLLPLEGAALSQQHLPHAGRKYLCAGLKAYLEHVDQYMRMLADLLRRGRPAADIMTILARQDELRRKALAAAGRNDPNPCGSGRKFKRCHGDVTPVHQPWKNPPSNQSHSR